MDRVQYCALQFRNARSTHWFDPLSPRRPWLERIAKVLGLAGYLPIFELHYAHRVGRLPVVRKDEFSDPKVGNTQYPPYSEALFVWLRETRCLNVAPTADALSRLRILEDCVLSINLVLLVEVIFVRGSPVSIQRCANILVLHRSPLSHFWIHRPIAPLTTPLDVPLRRVSPAAGAAQFLVNWLSRATRSCGSFTLLMRYSNSWPLCGSCLVTS